MGDTACTSTSKNNADTLTSESPSEPREIAHVVRTARAGKAARREILASVATQLVLETFSKLLQLELSSRSGVVEIFAERGSRFTARNALKDTD